MRPKIIPQPSRPFRFVVPQGDGTVAALVPWLWNLGSKADELSPWRVTIVAAVALLLVVASGSFLMYAKYKQFYEEDDANLVQGNERRP